MRGKESVKKGIWYMGGRKSIEKDPKKDKEGEDF